jgi:hypothetical protein
LIITAIKTDPRRVGKQKIGMEMPLENNRLRGYSKPFIFSEKVNWQDRKRQLCPAKMCKNGNLERVFDVKEF